MEILKVVGQIAGLGGIAFGVFLIIFRDVIRKNIFQTMTKEQSFKIIKLIIILTWLLAFVGIGAWVKGDVTINVDISSRADDLVAILEIRAEKIKKYLEKKYKKNSSDLISQFDSLHREHINQLKAGNFVAAHELLSEIHKLSFMTKLEEEKVFRVSYYCQSRKYTRGILISAYIADDYNDYPWEEETYSLSPKEKSVNAKGRGCGPRYIMANPADMNTVYAKVIEPLND